MAGDTSRENGKKGGRKIASHTLEAQEQRKKAIAMVDAELEAIFAPQIEKAMKGDTSAFNAVLDRAWGKPLQAMEMTGKDGKDLIPELSPKVAKLIDEYTHKRGETPTS